MQTEVEFVELHETQPLFASVDILLRSYGFAPGNCGSGCPAVQSVHMPR
jgi:hypothetical protein